MFKIYVKEKQSVYFCMYAIDVVLISERFARG